MSVVSSRLVPESMAKLPAIEPVSGGVKNCQFTSPLITIELALANTSTMAATTG